MGRCCRRCGVAGGERVPPAPLGWYSNLPDSQILTLSSPPSHCPPCCSAPPGCSVAPAPAGRSDMIMLYSFLGTWVISLAFSSCSCCSLSSLSMVEVEQLLSMVGEEDMISSHQVVRNNYTVHLSYLPERSYRVVQTSFTVQLYT